MWVFQIEETDELICLSFYQRKPSIYMRIIFMQIHQNREEGKGN